MLGAAFPEFGLRQRGDADFAANSLSPRFFALSLPAAPQTAPPLLKSGSSGTPKRGKRFVGQNMI
ncbi:hypothetical protein B1812_17250 [Methylocystis bryophila]|uniref:Uncharacterized protein n=1 Tax=Methylocystis bryophila TaxID=655015 RepID=A0A1W6MY79_9HYPH|nr:hypothetical protein B1812_17250 [Methylocystis bryophila]